ncbi:hypothetical protein F3157_00175 [Virgibacillus dakarensis]|uniref:LysM domain-containing protein n=1 Tax=Lentibacillus populi TaxID=1827502 RepID=A0A9W5TUS3_9BACI|nr:hypothetical protein [Lentibacillus populi]MBT2214480.1 hypothetical protein [Virgibacillus dakarensis]MTW84085.1 hypothetical protein [Virgibacillus dakarensis]GGB29191.1 hypothetical protein GCM10011409_03180 [Lentibacillus populi]
MYFFKKSGIYIIIILIIVSIYNDITSGTSLSPTEEPRQTNSVETIHSKRFKVIKVKVQAGDTVLSIAEEVNSTLSALDMNQILADFKLINRTSSHQLNIGEYYYFPLYTESAARQAQ